MLYAVSTSVRSLSSISTFSVIKLSLNNVILLSVNSLVNGLSLILFVCISKMRNWADGQIYQESNCQMNICFVLIF